MIYSLTFLKETLLLAAEQLWLHKTRSLLTTLGITIGVASVIAVVASLTGLRQRVLSEFESFGVNNIYVAHRRPVGTTDAAYPFSEIRINETELAAIRDNVDGLRSLTPVTGVTSLSVESRRSKIDTARVLGIWGDWHDLEGRPVIDGRAFNAVDELEARQVCVVNEQAVEELLLEGSPIGQSILIDGRRFEIVGIVAERQQGMFDAFFGATGTRAEFFVPFSAAKKMLEDSFFFFILGSARSVASSEDTVQEISALLRRIRRISADSPDTFEVEKLDEYVDQISALALAITLVAGGIVSISLIVGGVGIMNIMLVSVSERTREIGLRKAVGASSRAVLIQFLLEAVVLCSFGGLIGIVLGRSIAWGLTQLPGVGLEHAMVPFWAVAGSLAFSATTGVLFGMFPAIKAAKLSPIDALRNQ